jgi:hypothetical protein
MPMQKERKKSESVFPLIGESSASEGENTTMIESHREESPTSEVTELAQDSAEKDKTFWLLDLEPLQDHLFGLQKEAEYYSDIDIVFPGCFSPNIYKDGTLEAEHAVDRIFHARKLATEGLTRILVSNLNDRRQLSRTEERKIFVEEMKVLTHALTHISTYDDKIKEGYSLKLEPMIDLMCLILKR